MKSYKTDQEKFWAGEFGTEYISRNANRDSISKNLAFFAAALKHTRNINSCIEFGANIGINLKALKILLPKLNQYAIEINTDAITEQNTFLPEQNIFPQSILEYSPTKTFDLVLIKGVLIHINPEYLEKVYNLLYESSNRYLLICEYYNPSPIEVTYRGHQKRLFKRDFCGEMLDLYEDLILTDYGFVYHRDWNFPQDDINWFLLEKKQ